MLTLLIDNHDSFTYNLFQLLAEVNGAEPVVVRNDGASWEELLAAVDFDNVVLSPGPGRPERPGDFGVCAEAIRRCEAPLLGVCLGHQGLGWVHGGRVEPAPEPLHGHLREVEHYGSALFAGIPSPFQAVRYHSLGLARPLPPQLEEIAWARDGVPMALAHRARPQWGVQFHPESIATEHGLRLLANFRDLSERLIEPRPAGRPAIGAFVNQKATKAPDDSSGPTLRVRRLEKLPDPEALFTALYGESECAFWLDSSRPGPSARFSFMGDASGPLGAVVTYDLEAREVEVRRGEDVEHRRESIIDYLGAELARLGTPTADAGLPFDFPCGFAGYLGYELKAETGGAAAHSSPHPDAALIFADRLIALDHDRNHIYLLCLEESERPSGAPTQAGKPEQAAEAWLQTTAATVSELSAAQAGESGEPRRTLPAVVRRGFPDSPPLSLNPRWTHPRAQYLADIETCLDLLREGETYEVCLTNSASLDLATDPLDLYRQLRRVNPAPFAAYLRFGDRAVLSSSPERFVRVADGEAEARPIKGTSRRGATEDEDAALAAALAADEKTRAENLMIVDLLRNDLGAICEVGSVEVAAMMEVESYETVHQLVSAVRGRLRAGASAVDCVRSCFPPGSMTGAPKERTMEILDRLEGRARGVYSGAIGYFGLGGGCDLSVAIRTIVLADGRAEIGAGGAIVLQSRPEDEYEEMLLKAQAPLRAIEAEADPAPISLINPGRADAALPRYVPELDEQEPWP